jgi:uncharacterized RDD family membrane protein YckC
LKKNTANTDSRFDWVYNPNLSGPAVKDEKPGKIVNAIAFTIVFILITGLVFLWLGFLAVLIMIVFGLSFLKAYAAGVLFNMLLVAITTNKKTK